MSNSFRKIADVLEKSVRGIAAAIELILIDLVFGKSKYRRRGAKMRPIIHRTYNRRTVIIREPVPTHKVQSKE